MTSLIFGLSILLSQFYIFPSGQPQPAHYLIIIAFSLIFFTKNRLFITAAKETSLRYIYLLVLYSIAVNIIYSLIHADVEFFVASVYIIFGFATFLLTRKIIVDIDPDFLILGCMALIGLVILFILSLLDIGGFVFFPRYNAYFNDPNQMAFWTLCISAILLANSNFPKIIKIAIFVACFYILLKSGSRSAFVGFISLIFGFFILLIKEKGRKIKIKSLIFGVFMASSLFSGIYYFSLKNVELFDFAINRLELIDSSEQADIRGYTRIFEFPEYLVFGAGHGYDLRFNPEGTEIHSTIAGILFYYGIVGFFLFVIFFSSIFRRLAFDQKLFFIAPIMYSLSTFGFRTPIFWFYLGCFYVLALQSEQSIKRMRP
jgi:hypothetical protein